MAYQDLGRKKLLAVCESLQDVAFMEGYPRMEGRMMGIMMAPGKKKGVPKSAAQPRPSSAEGEAKVKPKDETKVEMKVETKVEAKDETKVETKAAGSVSS